MKRLLISAIALAGLGGCATYDYAGSSAPGGYYRGSPSYEYSYPDGYYGGYGAGYGGYGGGYGYYGGYGYPYGYGSSVYIVRPRHDGHDHGHGHGGHDDRPPPIGGADGPRPWKRPDGSYAVPGRTMKPPRGGRPPSAPDRAVGSPSRPPTSRPMPSRPQGGAPMPSRPAPSRPAPVARPVQQSQARPSAPAVPRQSHFRNRPLGRER